jgi:hypothetical protein
MLGVSAPSRFGANPLFLRFLGAVSQNGSFKLGLFLESGLEGLFCVQARARLFPFLTRACVLFCLYTLYISKIISVFAI